MLIDMHEPSEVVVTARTGVHNAIKVTLTPRSAESNKLMQDCCGHSKVLRAYKQHKTHRNKLIQSEQFTAYSMPYPR
jgi:hypothetical protein